jgi:predicted extracellular nuclease
MPIQRAVLRSTRAVLAAAAAALAGAFAQPAPDADPLCHADALQVHEVQGPGDDSPVQRRRVLVEGVVSVVMQGDPADPFRRDVGGFWIETPTAARDDDPRTSEGVFVASALPAQVGRRVRVRGTAVESYGATQIGSVFRVADCGPAGPLPPPVEIRLPADRPLGLEPYEGMRVVLPQELVIAEYYNYDRFGEIVLAAPQLGQVRPIQATQRFAPDDPAARAWQAEQERRRIVLDDGRSDQNPSPVRHPSGERFDLDHRFRGGDVVVGVQGVLHFAFERWRIHPTGPAEVRVANPRPAAPPDVGVTLRVATLNVLNYFVGFGEVCGPTGDMDCRGADDRDELRRQRAKLVAALHALDADVIGLIELQNHADDAALRDLVAGLNERAGADVWAWIPVGLQGTDAIAQGLIYRRAAVEPVGPAQVLDDPAFTDPRGTGQGKNRPALAQGFRDLASGATFAVVVTHFKSKGSPCGRGDDDPLQGSCAGTRTDAVPVLLDWLAGDPTGTGGEALILGDLNAYPREDAIVRLRAGLDGRPGTADDVVDLVERHAGPDAITFVFDGRFGRLDHAFATAGLARHVTGAAPWAINADEPDLIDYDTTFKGPREAALYAPDPYRASDHDPVLVGLSFGAQR